MFSIFSTFVLCWRGSFSLQHQPGLQHGIQDDCCIGQSVSTWIYCRCDHSQDFQDNKNADACNAAFVEHNYTNFDVPVSLWQFCMQWTVSVTSVRSIGVWYRYLETPTVTESVWYVSEYQTNKPSSTGNKYSTGTNQYFHAGFATKMFTYLRSNQSNVYNFHMTLSCQQPFRTM